MPARKTRERILETSLALFNERGEPNVSTNHIAEELEISPGNLYYHFRSKDDIVEHLFAAHEARLDAILALPGERLPDLEDLWFQLHSLFECLWVSRFLYRDLVDILRRNRRLRMRFGRLLRRLREHVQRLLSGLALQGLVAASPQELEAATDNVLLITVFWLGFDAVRNKPGETEVPDLAAGVYQAMMVIASLLAQPARHHLLALASAYRR